MVPELVRVSGYVSVPDVAAAGAAGSVEASQLQAAVGPSLTVSPVSFLF
jgi:hypothetical protein